MATPFDCLWLFLLLCSWICLIDRCHGSCFQTPMSVETTEFGRRRMFCEYDSSGSKLKLLPGSSLYTADCYECSCTQAGLECCGFGHKAGTFAMSGCVMKTDGCQPVFVKAENHTLECFSGKPVDFNLNPLMPHPDNKFSIDRSGKVIKSTPATQDQVPKPETVSLIDILQRLHNTKLAAPRPRRFQLQDILSKLGPGTMQPGTMQSYLQQVSTAQQVPVDTSSQRSMMQFQLQDILSRLGPGTMQPYLQQVPTAQQMPVDTSSQQSMTFTADTTQDIGWLPWMFLMN